MNLSEIHNVDSVRDTLFDILRRHNETKEGPTCVHANEVSSPNDLLCGGTCDRLDRLMELDDDRCCINCEYLLECYKDGVTGFCESIEEILECNPDLVENLEREIGGQIMCQE